MEEKKKSFSLSLSILALPSVPDPLLFTFYFYSLFFSFFFLFFSFFFFLFFIIFFSLLFFFLVLSFSLFLPLDTWFNVSHSHKCTTCHAMCHQTPDASKNVKFRMFQNPMKFNRLTRFHETNSTLKSFSSSEI